MKYTIKSVDFENNKYEMVIEDSIVKKVKVSLKCNDGYVVINNLIYINNNSVVYFDINAPQLLQFESFCDRKFSIEVTCVEKYQCVIDEVKNKDCLIVENEYTFRNFEGKRPISVLENREIDSALIFNYVNSWYQTYYVEDGKEVIKGNISCLKDLLLKYKYKYIVNKIYDCSLYKIIEAYTDRYQIKCFVLDEDYCLCDTPYFLSHNSVVDNSNIYDVIKSMRENNSIYWIVSDDGIKETLVDNTQVNNIFVKKYKDVFIDCNKTVDFNNKNILLNTNFDNNSFYMNDIVVLIIKQLLKKDNLKDYKFHIAGCGDFKTALLSELDESDRIVLYKNYLSDEFKKRNSFILEFKLREKYYGLDSLYNSAEIPVVFESIEQLDKGNLIGIVVDKNYIDAANKVEAFLINKEYDNNLNGFNQKVWDISEILNILSKSDIKLQRIKAKKNPVLSIVIPAYNIETFLPKCLDSLVYAKNIGDCEIIVVNDGSKDNTLKIAKEYEKNYPSVVRVFDKENGGHGSAVNLGMKVAKGKYFKILDSDDWFVTSNLEKMITKLAKETADLVLTKVRCEYYAQKDFPLQVDYSHLRYDVLYNFEDLLNNVYGLNSAPLFAASCYKTEKLRDANFTITEKKLYADHEFDAFSIKCIDTVIMYDLDIYMYLIGREGQSVSINVWEKKYVDHQNAMFKVSEKLENDKLFDKDKKKFVIEMVVEAMLIHQLDMLKVMNKDEESYPLVDKLRQYPEVFDIIFNDLKNKYNGIYVKFFVKEEHQSLINKAKKVLRNRRKK